MLHIKRIELELSDHIPVIITEQSKKLTLRDLDDLIISHIFIAKLQYNVERGTEFAQVDTAREIGMRSSSTIYRAVRRKVA